MKQGFARLLFHFDHFAQAHMGRSGRPESGTWMIAAVEGR